MNPTTLANLRAAAIQAAVIDPDVVALIAPDVIAKIESGELTAAGAITDLKAVKPGNLSPSVAQLDGTAYRQRRTEALSDLRKARSSIDLPAPSVPAG